MQEFYFGTKRNAQMIEIWPPRTQRAQRILSFFRQDEQDYGFGLFCGRLVLLISQKDYEPFLVSWFFCGWVFRYGFLVLNFELEIVGEAGRGFTIPMA